MEGKEVAGEPGGESPVTKAPAVDDAPPNPPPINTEPTENDSWWGSWSNSNWAKTITDVSSNITKSVSHGLELANQALDKEIEIEIDVDKVMTATKTIANKTIEHSKTIIEKSGGVVDQSMKLVDEGVKTVTKDVAELSEAIVEDSKATYSAFSEATYSTIEQVGGRETAKTATAVKDSVFGAVNAIASVILADSSDEEESGSSRNRTMMGPEARLNQLRVAPSTYCNEADDMIDYLQWLETFDLEEASIKADVSEVMVECPEVRALYSKLVPAAVSHSDFWQRYYYRLSLHNSAEMRRSRLVERANTEDEDDDLDSWGDDSDVDEQETTIQDTTTDTKTEPQTETQPKIDTEAKPGAEAKAKAEMESKSIESVETVERQNTPQSNESSKDSEWTAVDKSESDDWEREFDLEMTEEEIQQALKNEDKSEGDSQTVTDVSDQEVATLPGQNKTEGGAWEF